jgi:hypothetical protein
MKQKRILILVVLSLFLLAIQAISPMVNQVKETPKLDTREDTQEINKEPISIKSPTSADFIKNYPLYVHPLMETFDDTFNPDMWQLDPSTMGICEVRRQESILYMQAGELPYQDPGLPEDVTATTANLMPIDGSIGDAEISIRFIANKIDTRTKTIPGVDFPVPVTAFLYLEYSTTPEGGYFGNNIYTYTKINPFINQETIEKTFSLRGIPYSNYLSLRIHLLAYDNDQWVKIDYINVRSYTLNVTEAYDALPSGSNQQINLNFLETRFSLDTDGAQIRFYYDELEELVDSSDPYFAASGSSNPYTINIPAGSLRQVTASGLHTYKIRFRESKENREFWTETLRLYVYDSQAPVIGTPSYNPNPNYRQNMVITVYVTDAGGTGLKSARLAWNYYGADPVYDQPNQFVDTAVNQGAQSQTLQFVIPQDKLRAQTTIKFRIWVSDGRTFGGTPNTAVSPIYSFFATDTDAPEVQIFETEAVRPNPNQPGTYYGDLGYAGYVKFLVNDYVSGAGFDPNIGSYLVVKGYKVNGSTPTNYMDSTYYSSITDVGRRVSFLDETIISWDENAFLIGTVIHVFIHAQDSAGNTIFKVWNITIVDLRPPDVSMSNETMQNVVYNQTKELSFTAAKNFRAAQVNPTTARLEIGYNQTGFGTPIVLTVSSSGSSSIANWFMYNYSIPHTNYAWNTTIQIRFSINDTSNNQNITNFSFRVIDIFAPTLMLDRERSNVTTSMRTFWNYIFCINTSDQIDGAGVSHVTFYYKNGSGAAYDNSMSALLPLLYRDGIYFYYYMPTEYLFEGGISVNVTVFDYDNNSAWWYFDYSTSNITRPTVRNYFMDETNYYKGQYYTNKQTMNFRFELNLPVEMNVEFNGQLGAEGFLQRDKLAKQFTIPAEGLYTVKVYYEFYTWTKTIIADFTAPNKIETITGTIAKDKVLITWSAPTNTTEKIFYKVHRSNSSQFTANSSNLIATVEETFFQENLTEYGTFYYKVVVADLAMNLSPESSEVKLSREPPNYVAIGFGVGIVAAGSLVGYVYYLKQKKRDFYEMPQEKGGFFQKVKNIKQNFAKKETDTSEPANAAAIVKTKATDEYKPAEDLAKDTEDAWSAAKDGTKPDNIGPKEPKEETDGWE